MIERRNYYRILYVQPDASLLVIRESYRILMQRKKLQPDYDQDDVHTRTLQDAFSTLNDPVKRALYDSKLFKNYHIRILSRGAYSVYGGWIPKTGSRWKSGTERRNYYRILQIQPDAPIPVIAACYQLLKTNAPHKSELFDVVYKVLINPGLRQHYDAAVFIGDNSISDSQKREGADQHAFSVEIASNETAVTTGEHATDEAENFCCAFCGVSYLPRMSIYQNENCLECGSPLNSLRHEGGQTVPLRRTLPRVNLHGVMEFYSSWPGQSIKGMFQDWSPVGIRFLTNQSLRIHNIIKIDAPNLQAVAEVRHQHSSEDGISIGTRFIAVRFSKHQGNFVSTYV